MTTQPTCEQRIDAQMEGRLADFRTLAALAQVDDREPLDEIAGTDAGKAMLAELGFTKRQLQEAHEGESSVFERINEAADQRRDEYPLGVSAKTVFRIDLSTGGPGDWLEVECSGDTPNYEPAGEGEHYEVEAITYHFNDWFDHAERTLSGDDEKAAQEFAERVVPELIG